MKTLYIILFTLSILVSLTTIGKPRKPIYYECKLIGKQKIKPYKHKRIKDKEITTSIHLPKYRCSINE